MPSINRRNPLATIPKLMALSSLLFLLICSGCASRRAYSLGLRQLEQGQYDDAVSKITEAIELRPAFMGGKDEYFESLARAKREGASWHLAEARNYKQNTDLGLAEDHLLKGIEYNPSLSECNPFLAEIRRCIDKAETDRDKSILLAQANQWDQAVTQIRKALSQYRTMPRGEADCRRLMEGASNWHLQISRRELSADMWDKAADEARRSLSYVDNPGAKDVLDEIANRRKADQLIEKGKTLLESEKYQEALTSLTQAYELHERRADLPSLIVRAKGGICDGYLAKAAACASQGDRLTSLRLLIKSQTLLAGYGGVASQISRVRQGLAAGHLDMANKNLNDNLPSNALLHLLAAASYEPDNENVQIAIDRCSSVIRRQIRYNIGLVPFQSSERNKAMASRFESAALQHLLLIKPQNVSIMDRADLKKVLQEQDMGLTDLVEQRFRIRPGQLKGVDALIIGQIISCDVMKNQSTAWGNSKYQWGMKYVHNPHYDKASQEVNAAMQQLQAAQRDLGTANAGRVLGGAGRSNFANLVGVMSSMSAQVARQNVASARARLQSAQMTLSGTPQQIQVPNIQTHQYPINTVVATAKLSSSLKVLDSLTGSVLLAEAPGGIYRESDRYIKGDPQRNVPEDPLDLPDEQFMRDKAVMSSISELEDAIERAAQKHGHRFLVMAKRANAARDQDQAIENAINYLFAYPTGATQAEFMIELLDKPFSQESDLISLPDLLRQYCRVLQKPGKLPLLVSETNMGVKLQANPGTELARKMGTHCMLTAVEGYPVSSLRQLRAVLSTYGQGEQVTLSLKNRDNARTNTTVTLIPK